jgi:hypothetical protein
MRKLAVMLVGVAMLCTLIVIPAQATILTFANSGVLDWSAIPGAYGDNVNSTSVVIDGVTWSYSQGFDWTPNVTVDYRTVTYPSYAPPPVSSGTTYASNLAYWSTLYGDLVDVAFPIIDESMGELSLIPEPGFDIILNSFDLGGWPQVNYPNQTVRILSEDYSTILWAAPGTGGDGYPYTVIGAGPSHSSFTLALVSSSTIRI